MNYSVGDLIRYQPHAGPVRVGVVVDKSPYIKNNRPGFDIRTSDGNYYWGYDDQIISVEST